MGGPIEGAGASEASKVSAPEPEGHGDPRRAMRRAVGDGGVRTRPTSSQLDREQATRGRRGESSIGTRANAVERVYRALRTGILDGTYPFGARLGEVDLAAAFGVSRTPVREALRRLESEGIVEVVPYRGVRVRRWSAQEIDDIFDLRAVLEGYAAGRAAQRATASDVAALDALCDEMEALAGAGPPSDLDHLAALNGRLHRRILELSGNALLPQLVWSITQLPLVVSTFGHYSADELRRSMRHHRELVDALRAHDPRWATAVMQAHVRAARRVILGPREHEPPTR